MRPHPSLSPLASVYGAAVAARLELYRRGILRVARAGRPVVSVGNLAVGGTGKTPFVRWLAGELLQRGQRPAILTRGYGRKSRGPVLVSNGAGEVASVEDAGDEAALLSQALPRVPILADARRSRGAAIVEARFPDVGVHILDDGFSHVGLARDVDVVLLDATDPDAGGALLPAGLLREPMASLARADVIVVTKTEQADPERAHALSRRYAPGVPIYHAETSVVGIENQHGEPVAPRNLPPRTLVAVAGIARPEAFWSTVEALGIEPVERLAFLDHEPYGAFTQGRILKVAEETGATAVLTTEKDSVKLVGRLSLPVFRVGIAMRVLETSFVRDLIARFSRPPS